MSGITHYHHKPRSHSQQPPHMRSEPFAYQPAEPIETETFCCTAHVLSSESLRLTGFSPVHRRSMSATQLSHLQEFSIAGFGGSGTIFASHSPRAAPPNPAFALPSPTATPLDGLTSHPVSVSVSDGSFVTPLASPLPSPMMSPLRGGEGGVSTGVGTHWQQGPANRAPSPSGIALCVGSIAPGCFLFVNWSLQIPCMQYCIIIDVVVFAMLFINCVAKSTHAVLYNH